MNGNVMIRITVSLALLGGCQKGEDEGKARQQRLERACDAWCTVATPCSTYFAGPEKWDFDDVEECKSICIQHVEETVDIYDESCFDIVVENRECAGALTCEEFIAYEQDSFGYPPSIIPIPCVDQIAETLMYCDY